jgi:hypothetical protein
VFHRLSAKNVLLGHHHRLVQSSAGYAIVEHTPLQMGLRAKIAWLGHFPAGLDQLHVKSVLPDIPRQLVQCYAPAAHIAHQGTSSLQTDFSAKRAFLAHTPQILECGSLSYVPLDHHHNLDQRAAIHVHQDNTLDQTIPARTAMKGHTLILRQR